MPDDALREKVIQIALERSGMGGDELLILLEREWNRAGLAVADRGPGGDYARTIVMRVWRQARRQRDTAEVIVAMSADSALHWAAEYHLASDRYALVIGLIAAWVARAILDDPDEPETARQEDPEGT